MTQITKNSSLVIGDSVYYWVSKLTKTHVILRDMGTSTKTLPLDQVEQFIKEHGYEVNNEGFL